MSLLFAAVMLAGSGIYAVYPAKKTYAAGQITNRSLTLKAGTIAPFDGGSLPGGEVNHAFLFSLPSATAIGSIKILYCTTATGNDGDIEAGCTPPPGLSTTAATLGASSGGAVFDTVTSTAANSIYVSRTTAAAPSGAVTVQLNNVTNPYIDNTPANSNITFFARIMTYANSTATGIPVDAGTVTASTANKIELTGIMPESLIFCTGATIDVNAGNIPQCSTATSGTISFNQLFSPESTSWATSQMAASTNATTGYVITAAGPALTSGGNTIPAIGGTAAGSNQGTGQFGMNLADNSSDPTIGSASNNPITYYTDPEGHTGAAIIPAANGSNFRGQARPNFNTASSFAFAANTDNVIAASDNTAAGPTDSQRYTTTYMVNVSGSQPAGTYTSTITYICTPSF